MSGTVALVFALTGVVVIGLVVFFTGVVQTVTARRRSSAVQAPIIATGIGFAIVLAAGVALIADASGHPAFTTYSELR